ncbi:hypothetical protein [Rhodocista pekingensis]|uniref:Uncharacterized protein n=1 Tax=Rhodocista pekingensis TaxID=201185 RepID=A0ABW2L2Q1_9PROT
MQTHKDCVRVCRVLAAQLAEVQARFEKSSGELIATLDRLDGAVVTGEGKEDAGRVRNLVDDILFSQAQEHDLIRQMMEVVAQALALLPDDIDVDGLAALYISEAQHRVHRQTLMAPPEAGDAG